jgi:hypothetical protein
MDQAMDGIEDYLDLIRELEFKINSLILKSNLTEDEKKFILDHIFVVPKSNK